MLLVVHAHIVLFAFKREWNVKKLTNFADMSSWTPGPHNSGWDPTGQGQNYPTTRPRTLICVKAQGLGYEALKLLQLIGCVIRYNGCSTVAQRLHVRNLYDSDQR